jgi:hypothetical protein
MSLGTILLIILILILVGALPTWPYSSGWGYYPAGGLGLVLIILLILVLLGRLYGPRSPRTARPRRQCDLPRRRTDAA